MANCRTIRCYVLVIFASMAAAEVRAAAYLRSSEIMNNNVGGAEGGGGGGGGGYDRYGTTNGNAGGGGRRQGKFYEDLFKSKPPKTVAPPPPKSPSPQARIALGEKQMCMAKFNLGERSLDDKYVGVLRHEVGKLQELVDVLRTQQKIMKDLSEVEDDKYGDYYDYKPKEEDQQKAVVDKESFAKLCEEVRNLKSALKSMKLVPDEEKLADEVKVQNENIGRLKQLLSQLNAEGARQNGTPAGNKRNVTDILSKLDDIENRLSKYVPPPKPDEIVGNSYNDSSDVGARASSSSSSSSLDSLFDLLKNDDDDDAADSSSSSTNIDVTKFLSSVGKEEKATKSDPDVDIETKLLELQKKLAKQKQLEKLEKQIKESRGLSVSSHGKDESAQVKRLEKMLKKLTKVESKTTDDDDIDLNLKSLEKAIKSLQPKEEEEDDEDEEEEEVDVSALLEKMIPKKKKKKKAKLTQSAIKKLLLKGSKGDGGYDNDDYFDKYGYNGLSEISFDGPSNLYQPPSYGGYQQSAGYGGYGGYQQPDDYSALQYLYHYPGGGAADKNYRFFHKPPSYGSDSYYPYYHKVDPYDGKPDSSFFHYDRKYDADAGHRPVRGGYPKAGPAGQYNSPELYSDPSANHGDYSQRTLDDLRSQIYELHSALGAYAKPDDGYAVDEYKPPPSTSYDPKNDIPSGQQTNLYGDAAGQDAGYGQRKSMRVPPMYGDAGPSARAASKSRQSANQQLVDMLSTFGDSARTKRDAGQDLVEKAANLLNRLLDQADAGPQARSHSFTLEDLKDKIKALHNQLGHKKWKHYDKDDYNSHDYNSYDYNSDDYNSNDYKPVPPPKVQPYKLPIELPKLEPPKMTDVKKPVEEEHASFGDKVFEKIIDKIIEKVKKVAPKLIDSLLGFDGDHKGGISGLLPMIVMKLLAKLEKLFTFLQKSKFFKHFFIPAAVLLLVAGSVIFLVWWLQFDGGKEELPKPPPPTTPKPPTAAKPPPPPTTVKPPSHYYDDDYYEAPHYRRKYRPYYRSESSDPEDYYYSGVPWYPKSPYDYEYRRRYRPDDTGLSLFSRRNNWLNNNLLF